MWFIPNLRVRMVDGPFRIGGGYLGLIDLGWGERLGGQGLRELGGYFGRFVHKVQGVVFGLIIFFILIWLVIVWGFYFF